MCGLATTHRGRFVDRVAALGLRFATIIHPTARVSRTTEVGEGSIVSAGVVVGAYSKLDRHVLVNRGALVGHHTEIGEFVSIQPGANVAGACTIGARTPGHGVGRPRSRQRGVGVGGRSGAVVTRDVRDNVQVVGVPAHVVQGGRRRQVDRENIVPG